MANDPLKNSIRQVFTTQWLDEFDNNSVNNYFMFIGKPLPWPGSGDTGVPPTLIDSRLIDLDTWRHMLGVKRINANDVYFLVDRYNWTQNTVYDYYDDSADMFDDRDSADATNPKKFYVINTDNHVYKCLWNNNGAQSTETPTGTDPSNSFTTSDKYIWKYLFTVLENDIKFLSDEFVPVKLATALDSRVNQFNTQENAIDGSIDFIIVSAVGGNYKGIVAPGATFAVQSVGGASNIFLSTLSGASHSGINGFYNGYNISLVDGVGVGQTREILSYNGTNKEAGITPSWDINPSTSSKYTITPTVVITGDGIGAVARTAAVGATLQIDHVVMIDRGSGYSWATASVGTTADDGVGGGTAAVLRPFVSPQDGHGKNTITELGVRDVVVSTEINRSEGSKITVSNDFRQFGIIQNPVLNTGTNAGDIAGTELDKEYDISVKRPEVVNITFGASANYVASTDYAVGEVITQGVVPSQIKGEVVEWTAAAVGAAGSVLIAKEIIGSFGATNQTIIGASSGVAYNATGATIVDNLGLSNFNNTMFDTTGNGYLIGKESLSNANITKWTTTGAKTGTLTVKDLSGKFLTSTRPKQYGELITHYTVSGTAYAFSTEIIENAEVVDVVVSSSLPELVYRQTHTLNVSGTSLLTTSFTLDATAQGASSSAYGTIVDWVTNGTTGVMNLVAPNGAFNIGEEISLNGVTVVGNATLTTQNKPELVFDSGKILYIQNMRPIDRDPGQLEEIHINIGF